MKKRTCWSVAIVLILSWIFSNTVDLMLFLHFPAYRWLVNLMPFLLFALLVVLSLTKLIVMSRNCWPVIVGLTLSWIMSDIFPFNFFLENPQYRWVIGGVAVLVVVGIIWLRRIEKPRV